MERVIWGSIFVIISPFLIWYNIQGRKKANANFLKLKDYLLGTVRFKSNWLSTVRFIGEYDGASFKVIYLQGSARRSSYLQVVAYCKDSFWGSFFNLRILRSSSFENFGKK